MQRYVLKLGAHLQAHAAGQTDSLAELSRMVETRVSALMKLACLPNSLLVQSTSLHNLRAAHVNIFMVPNSLSMQQPFSEKNIMCQIPSHAPTRAACTILFFLCTEFSGPWWQRPCAFELPANQPTLYA